MLIIVSNPYCEDLTVHHLQAQLDEQTRLLSERGMVLVGNEEEEVSCEDQDRANANGYFDHELRPDDDQVQKKINQHLEMATKCRLI